MIKHFVIVFSLMIPLCLFGQSDTLGWNSTSGFNPVFNKLQTLLYTHSSGGYVYGTNSSSFGMNKCAQGYQNTNNIPVKVHSVLVTWGTKDFLSADSLSGCTFKIHPMAMNEAYNDDGSGTNYAANSMGPTDSIITKKKVFTYQIDTSSTFQVINFPQQPTLSGDFAISVDFRNPKQKGDVIGIMSDTIGSANELDFAFSWAAADSAHWFVTDFLMSIGQGGTGAADNSIAIFPVVDATLGIHDRLENSIVMYPNPVKKGHRVIIEQLKNQNAPLLIINASGKIITQLESNTKYIQTQTLSPGVYYVLSKGTTNRFAQRLIITN